MGKRGPKPTPTNLKLVRGETRPSRVNRNEPKAPQHTAIVPPDYLDADALAVWERLAPSLHTRGVLTPWDLDLFASFCTAVVHHRRAVEKVNAADVLIDTTNGPVKHPALQVVRDQAALMTTIGARFGLTPSDRSTITLPPEENHGAAAAILD